jgi:hypothetical protein
VAQDVPVCTRRRNRHRTWTIASDGRHFGPSR